MALQAGPFAAVIMGFVAWYSERNRRATIRSVQARHSKELDKRDAKYKELMANYHDLNTRIAAAALDGD